MEGWSHPCGPYLQIADKVPGHSQPALGHDPSQLGLEVVI